MSTFPPLVLLHCHLTWASLWHLRAISHSIRDEVDMLLHSTRHVQFTNILVPQLPCLLWLLQRLNGNLVTTLEMEVRVVDNTKIVGYASPITEPATPADELSDADKKTIVAVLPLGILSLFPQLQHLRVTSRSHIDMRTHTVKLHTTAPWSIVTHTPFPHMHTIGIQLGLANLHEIADSLVNIVTICACHIETCTVQGSNQTVVSDLWGPDATPLVLQRLREQCPHLRALGTISSPGPRILSEIRRRWPSTCPYPDGGWTSLEEVNDCYVNSILDKFLQSWSSLQSVTVCVCSKSAPYASGRATIFHLQHGTELWNDGNFLGELQDVLSFMNKASIRRQSSAPVEIRIVVRDYEVRCDANSTLAKMEQSDSNKFACLVASESLKCDMNVSVWCVPSGDDNNNNNNEDGDNDVVAHF